MTVMDDFVLNNTVGVTINEWPFLVLRWFWSIGHSLSSIIPRLFE